MRFINDLRVPLFCPIKWRANRLRRVSTIDQNLALQRDTLTTAGCERVFTDEGVSGSITARRGLDGALAALRPGDTLMSGNWIGLGDPSLTSLRSSPSSAPDGQLPQLVRSDRHHEFRRTPGHAHHGRFGRVRARFDCREDTGWNQAAKKRGVRLGRRPSLAAAQIAHARALVERAEIAPCGCTHDACRKVDALSCTEGR